MVRGNAGYVDLGYTAKNIFAVPLRSKIKIVRNNSKRFCTENHARYVRFVSRRLGLAHTDKFNVLERLPELLRAMARFESGQEWAEELFVPYSIAAVAWTKKSN